MKRGVILPTFRWEMSEALAMADACADAGIDGVFAYDHLFPMNAPERPAFAPLPLLARVARRHPTLTVGPLVARVGMTSPAHLAEALLTLQDVAEGRAVAGLGTGDALSTKERLAWGLAAHDANERRRQLGEVAERVAASMPVWVGGGSPATEALAREIGAEVNLWHATPEAVAAAGAGGHVNTAGPVPDDLHAHLDAMEAAGATWSIYAPSVDVAALASWRSRKTL